MSSIKETFSSIRGRQISKALIKKRSKPTEACKKMALDIQRDYKFPGNDDATTTQKNESEQ